MKTTTINDLFARYSDLCGAAGPQMSRDALQADFRDWCRARDVEARYEVQGDAYFAASDGAFSEAAMSDVERDSIDAPTVAAEVSVGVQRVAEETPVDGEGRAFWVTADVDGLGFRCSVDLYACPHPDGRPGLEPCGAALEDWCDSTLIETYGREVAAILGREAIALARI